MAYLHCHSCDWGQDDFWSFRFRRKYGYFKLFGFGWEYNPISCFLSYVNEYAKPRRLEFDKYYANEMGWKRHDVHSWWLLWQEFKDMLKSFRRQKWWTYKGFKKAKEKKCPKCGSTKLDID